VDTGVVLVAHEEEPGEPRIHVEPSDAQGVVVVPEGSTRLDLVTGQVVGELVGEAPVHEVPRRSDDVPVGAEEELRVAVELEVGVAAVDVRDHRDAVALERVPGVAGEGVAPVQRRVDRQDVAAVELVVPPHPHHVFVVLVDVQRAPGPRGSVVAAPVAVDGRREALAGPRVDEPGLVGGTLGADDVDAVVADPAPWGVLERRRQRVRRGFDEHRLIRRVHETHALRDCCERRRRGVGMSADGEPRDRGAGDAQGAQPEGVSTADASAGGGRGVETVVGHGSSSGSLRRRSLPRRTEAPPS
jgi:hypothetical protein